MKTIRKGIALFVLGVLLAGMMPGFAFAAQGDTVKLTVSSTLFVMQGQSSYVDVETTASKEQSYQLVMECEDKNVSISGNSGVLSGDAKHTFTVSAKKGMETGYYEIVLKAIEPGNPANILSSRRVYLNVTKNQSSFTSANVPRMEVSYLIRETDSLETGKTNNLKVAVYNSGNKDLRDSQVTITLPAGLSIQSGSSSRMVGTIKVGSTIYVDYPILVDSELESGSYPIEVKVNSEYVEQYIESYSDHDATKNEIKSIALSDVIYVPVIGKDKQGPKDESVPLLIVDAFDYGGGILKRGANFNLKLTFLNTGSRDIHNVVINVLDNSGAIVPAGTSFIKIDSIKSGEKADGTIALRTVEGTDITQTSLSVDMKYYDPDNRQQESSYPIVVSIEKKPEEGGKGGVTNPILMVTNYDLGGSSSVLAGSDFPLSLTITNTSGKTLRNIKVTVQDSTGSILPAQGSNSFFIGSVAPGASFGKLLPMTVNHNVQAGNDTVAVNMSYEDMDGGTYTSADTITVPIVQQDRLVIDDILDPGWLMAGQQGYVQIRYYNMGQTTLNNLRIVVSGDFTVDGDSSQYVGNMANGRSDYFSFNFFPEGEGEMNGKAVFTYEDAQGEEHTIEKTFTFNIQPAPEWEDPGDMPIEPVKTPMPLWQKILIAAAAAAAAAAAIVLRKKHKKKKAEELDLDE